MKRLPKRLRGILKFCACISCFNLCLERAKVFIFNKLIRYKLTKKLVFMRKPRRVAILH